MEFISSLLSPRSDHPNTGNMTFDSENDNWSWPSEEAERAKLYVPNDCVPLGSKPQTCVFRYEEDRRLLTVALDGEEGDNIIDIIDPADIIGVNVEIKMMDPGESDLLSQIHRDQGQSPQTAADNEPRSEVPFDMKATAVLSLYAYPKGNPPSVRDSVLRFCGSERTPTKPSGAQMVYRDKADESNSNTSISPRYGHHRRYTVAPVEDFTDLSIVVNAIRKLSRAIPSGETRVAIPEEERILVIVNPQSGKKLGVHMYDTTLRPMLDQAGIAHDCLVTTHSKHAEERMEKQSSTSDFRDVSDYTGIVLVGGDGIIHEVLQGIHRRGDRDQILKRLKLGTLGAGTSNGFSASLAHASKANHSPVDCAFAIVKGISSSVDLSRYETKSKSYTSFLTFSWAMIADIDIESECIRWVGFLRMDIWGVVRVLFLRRYRAKFSYLPPTADKTTISIPPLSEPIPDTGDWITCEDDFILFWASQSSHAGEQMFHAPPCKLNDGVFQIMVVR